MKNDAGEIVELRATYDPQTRGGDNPPPDAEGKVRKVKGTLHWVSAQHAVDAEVWMFDRLFTAENPDKRFLPSPGPLDSLVLPQGEGLRVECGYVQGNEVTPFYDPLVMKLIAHGADRAQAVARLIGALDRLQIQGIRTNAPFLRGLLRDTRFETVQHDTRMLDRG